MYSLLIATGLQLTKRVLKRRERQSDRNSRILMRKDEKPTFKQQIFVFELMLITRSSLLGSRRNSVVVSRSRMPTGRCKGYHLVAPASRRVLFLKNRTYHLQKRTNISRK